jgi:hypothetical protein
MIQIALYFLVIIETKHLPMGNFSGATFVFGIGDKNSLDTYCESKILLDPAICPNKKNSIFRSPLIKV